MKIIFLDIDGVLNSFQTFKDIYYEYKKTGKRRIEIDEDKVLLLKEIVDNTDALIVLSSTWRYFGKMINGKLVTDNVKLQSLIDILSKYNMFIYDITPRSKSGNREEEIREWLENKNVDDFIVIDDDSYDLQGFINKELIKTNYIIKDSEGNYYGELCGLIVDHVYEAIEKLNSKKLVLQRI